MYLVVLVPLSLEEDGRVGHDEEWGMRNESNQSNQSIRSVLLRLLAARALFVMATARRRFDDDSIHSMIDSIDSPFIR